jgi:hypothetical protein
MPTDMQNNMQNSMQNSMQNGLDINIDIDIDDETTNSNIASVNTNNADDDSFTVCTRKKKGVKSFNKVNGIQNNNIHNHSHNTINFVDADANAYIDDDLEINDKHNYSKIELTREQY